MTARMKSIKDLAEDTLEAPFLKIVSNDNIMSSVIVCGSLDPVEEWENDIFENSRCFKFMITPARGKRYYEDGEKVTVKLILGGFGIEKSFRKSTSTPEKVLARIDSWIKSVLDE